MKFPQRRIKGGIAVAATLGLTAGLAACSSPSASDGGTLVVANYQFLEPGRGDQLWTGLLGYEEYNDQATLEQSASPYLQYVDKLNTELGAGGGPDVFVVQEAQFATLADAGVLEPLDDVVADSGLNDLNDGLQVDGEQLGVIWEQVTYALIGNKNLMDQAGIDELPTDIDGLIEASQDIQDATDADGFAVRHLMSEFDSWWMDYNVFPYGYNGSWSDGSALTINSPENVAGLEAYRQIYDAGIMPIGDDASTFRTKFKENQLGFMIENNGATLSFTSDGQIDGTDIVSGPLPFDHPGQHQRIVFAVNKNSDNVELAKDFIHWFVSEEGQAAIRPGLGASSLATDVPLSADFESEHPWAPVFLEQAPESRSNLIEGFETETKTIMQIIMQAVERVVTQGQDPAEALNEAQSEAESSIR